MKKIVFLGMLAALLPAIAQPAGAQRRTVRLMTYNVGVFSKEIDDSAPMVAQMIAELGAETVALNELDSCTRRHALDQVKHLSDELNRLEPDGRSRWQGRFGRAMHYSGGAFGNGVVTRTRIMDHFNIALPKEEGSEPRGCVVIETPHYVFASCHLDHIGKAARLEQARVLTEELQRRYGDSRKPVFLAGDFNDTPDSPVIRQLSHDWTILSPLDESFPAKEPRRCIDYIFLLHNRAAVRVKGGAVVTDFISGDVRVASDHLPVFIEVAF